MYLSGSVGYTLLKYNNKDYEKNIFILADIHDGVSYCKQDSIMIDKWLTSKDRNDILLEEAIREEVSLTDLWPGSEHTQRLKTLNKINKKIKPIDIRPLLIPFSWELFENNDNSNKQSSITLDEYLIFIDNVLNLKSSKLMIKYIVPEIKKLYKDGNETINKKLIIHFEEIRKLYFEYREKNKEFLKKTISEIYKIDLSILEEINNITSMIMEWYILLLIFNSKTSSIIHMGLAHSNRIIDFLIEVYLFEIIKKSGINMMSEINNNPHACLLVPTEINSKFI
jgi:hypothetical protein